MGYKAMSIRDVLSAYEEGGIILPAIQETMYGRKTKYSLYLTV